MMSELGITTALSQFWRRTKRMPLYAKLGLSALLIAVVAWLLAEQLGRPDQTQKNSLVLALLALVALGTLLAKGMWDMCRSAYLEGTIPPSNRVSVFIEDIGFKVPQIPERFFRHELSQVELERFKQQFLNLKDALILTTDEAHRINNFSKKSLMLWDVFADTPVAYSVWYGAIEIPIFYYHRFNEWAKIFDSWSTFLNLHGGQDRQKALHSLISEKLVEVRLQLQGGNPFEQIVSMWANGNFDLSFERDNDSNSVDYIFFTEQLTEQPPTSGNTVKTEFMHIRDMYFSLGQSDIDWTSNEREKIKYLFSHACTDILAELFEKAKSSFVEEAERMNGYVLVWNDILKDRWPNFFEISATVSNQGRFDALMRTMGKVAIGTPGSGVLIDFAVIVERNDQDILHPEGGRYFTIGSRNSKSMNFIARLQQDQSKQVKSAYESGLFYSRLGLMVSRGDEESMILSPASPFSVEARRQEDEKLQKLKVKIRI